MGVVRAKLIKDYNGVKSGQYIQVLEPLYKTLKENGFFADPDPELEALKKKSPTNPVVSDVSEEE